MALTKSAEANGRKLLMKAALRLCMRTRSLQALGLREIGREAGLNPNTFYRHFKTIDDIGLALIEVVVKELRQPLRDLRYQAAASVEHMADASVGANPVRLRLEKAKRANRETVRLFFDFVLQHSDAFTLGVRELHGASPVLRQALRQTMEAFAADMAEDIRVLQLLPMLDEAVMNQLSSLIIRHFFQLSMDYIEYPERREAIRAQAEDFVLTQFAGSVVLQGVDVPLVNMLAQVMREPG